MQNIFTISPIYVFSDADYAIIKQQESPYIKGLRIFVNKNSSNSTNSQTGWQGSFGKKTKLLSNKIVCDITLPIGNNLAVGGYESQKTREFYSLIWNSNGDHTLYVIDESGSCKVIDKGTCLGLSNDPKHAIKNRCYLRVVENADGTTDKYFIYTDGNSEIKSINVNLSIATGGYANRFFGDDKCQYRELAPEAPLECIGIEYVPSENAMLKKKCLKFAYKIKYLDGTSSVYSAWSKPFAYELFGCSKTGCAKLTIPAGNGTVAALEIAMQGCDKEWYGIETIKKFDDCDKNKNLWERVIWGGYDYNPSNNTVSFTYCGLGECRALNQADVRIFENNIPKKSKAMSPLGDFLLFSNNLLGHSNFDCNIEDYIDLQLEKQDCEVCKQQFHDIEVYAVIHNSVDNLNQAIWGSNSASDNGWGGHNGLNNQVDFNVISKYQQNIKEKGFIGYLEGSNIVAESEQYIWETNGSFLLNGIDPYRGNTIDNNQPFADDIANNKRLRIQKWTFKNVPDGKYRFRIANHLVTINDNYENTSTYVKEVVSMSQYRTINGNGVPLFVKDNKEIEIDICGKDYDGLLSDEMLLIEDLTEPKRAISTVPKISVLQGYVYEGTQNLVPIENAPYVIYNRNGANINTRQKSTDYNGFYYGASAGKVSAYITTYDRCEQKAIASYTNSDPDVQIENAYAKDGYQTQYNIPQYIDNKCNFVILKGRVINQLGVGVANINVFGTGVKYTTTRYDGSFELKLHRTNVYSTFKLILNSRFDDCSCNICYEKVVIIPPCINCTETTLDIGDIVQTQNEPTKSLKSDGVYSIGFKFISKKSRATFVNKIKSITIPEIDTKNSCYKIKLKVSKAITSLMTDYDKISFFITKNTKQNSYVQWTIDWVEYLDDKGDITQDKTQAVKARIVFKSLYEYGQKYNFTNATKYQYTEGDVMKFYYINDLGNYETKEFDVLGTFFNDATQDGNSVIINYNDYISKLKGTCGTRFEIYKPKICAVNEDYYETGCGILKKDLIENDFNGYLEAFDTYRLKRDYKNIAEESYERDAVTNAIKKVNRIYCKTLQQIKFETPYINELNTCECNSFGRTNKVNEYSKEQWHEGHTIRTDAFVNGGEINGYGTFREENAKVFDVQEFGGIVATLTEYKAILFICKNDWFVTDYNMNYVRINGDGLAVASLDNTIADPHQKIGSNFGCREDDIKSIDKFDGIVVWADTKNAALVNCDFRSATDISTIKNKGWFYQKFKHLETFNKTASLQDIYEVICHIDPLYNEIIVTFRPRRGLSQNMLSYVNLNRRIRIDHQETFVFNIEMKEWVRFTGYTAENYGRINTTKGVELLSFALGVAYSHNSVDTNTYNVFFGIPTESVLHITATDAQDKEKIWQSVAYDCNDEMYFIDEIVTPEKFSYSYVPLAYFEKKENEYYAEFLKNMNSFIDNQNRVQLYDGKNILGKYINFVMVCDNKTISQYSELGNIQVRATGAEKSNK